MKYAYLSSELAKQRISNRSVCRLLGICEKTLWNKMRGVSEFTLDEAITIRDAFFPQMRIDELFATN